MNDQRYKSPLRGLGSTLLPVWIAINVLIAAATVFSGYASNIDQEYMPFAGLAAMTFPVWFGASALLIIVNLLCCRWLSLLPAAVILITMKPFLVFSPLNFGRYVLTPEEQERSFKILSYNVVSFVDEEGLSTSDFNRTMHTILQSDADAVVLLEYENQGPLSWYVPQSQIDSLHTIYPYFQRGSRGTVMFAKRPILHVVPPENMRSKGNMEVFRTNVAGRPLNIFAVHLESIGLDDNDKALYSKLANSDIDEAYRSTFQRLRSQIIRKLYEAFAHRAWQGKMLRSYIEQLGGDAVVCGDFNDIPGCRTIKVLEEIGLKDAYAETALGPTVTFNAPHFMFRIDHVLWRGNLRAVEIKRGNVASSDHYPMLTTFVWDEATQRGTND